MYQILNGSSAAACWCMTSVAIQLTAPHVQNSAPVVAAAAAAAAAAAVAAAAAAAAAATAGSQCV